MKKKQSETLKKLYAYKEWLESKINLYQAEIDALNHQITEQVDFPTRKYEKSVEQLHQEVDDWQKLINEAEAALVFIKTLIAFKEN